MGSPLFSVYAKYEAVPWLHEWLQHYRWQGAAKIYLVCDSATPTDVDPTFVTIVAAFSAVRSQWILVTDMRRFSFCCAPGGTLATLVKRLGPTAGALGLPDIPFPIPAAAAVTDGDLVRLHAARTLYAEGFGTACTYIVATAALERGVEKPGKLPTLRHGFCVTNAVTLTRSVALLSPKGTMKLTERVVAQLHARTNYYCESFDSDSTGSDTTRDDLLHALRFAPAVPTSVAGPR